MKRLIAALIFASVCGTAPAFATLSDTTDGRQTRTGDGVATIFVYTFPAGAATDISATVTLAGVLQPASYTVILFSDQINSPGGQVSFTTAPANGSTITLQRNEALTQQTSLSPYSPFPAKTVERTFDGNVRKIQQVDLRVADLETKEQTDISNTIAGGVGAADLIAPIATGATTAATLAARFGRMYYLSDFLPLNYVTDCSVDYASQIISAIAATQSSAVTRTLRLPKGCFKTTGLLSASGISVMGEGPDNTEIDCYATGTCLTFSGTTSNTLSGLKFVSKAVSQSGVLLAGGTGAKVQQLRILDFDTNCFKAGVVDVSGVYFSNIDYIECNNATTAGTTGIIVDGGGTSISSNASNFKNVFVKGKWATLYDIRGNDNIFTGGDAEMNNSSSAITQTYKISGGGNKFHDTYMEQAGATFPTTLVNFTSTSISNVFDGVYLTASGLKNVDAAIINAGTGNEFRPGPIGFNFPAHTRTISPQNLLANSGFASMRTTTLPLAYTDIFGTGTISRDSITVRGSAYSMKLDVAAARAGIVAYVATNSPGTRFPIDPVPVAKLTGRTVTASVWANSNTAGVGAIKIFDGSQNVGAAIHTGSGSWELLTVTTKVQNAANEVGIQLRTDTDGLAKTGTVYFSEPQLVIGNEAPHPGMRWLNDYHASMAGALIWAPAATFTDLNATPSVSDGNFFKVSNSAGTTITNFSSGQSGQEIKLLTTNGNTTLANNATIATTTGAAKLLTTNTVYKLIFDGTKWWEF